ncbi:Putative tetratricopeptide-like helical domain superfamily, anaphase-promoting complex subunit 5 [Septoria linicola]|uniref:Anaphase-promoting complex subunit 5 n=1 Tax=Septoria linicola TaxID=215465 RepID=A0A9Q9AQ13_9PEZI|nr:putative tetratricopeptide-like helical domain superfamily, anaphase-promoting complex subunit 5 [Septoria linicola]USW50470.1 Putative tetratricopeptide-like helical domain superfamily, anaphase-promoting complex subunit 5 [Septoria linicola]
MPRFLTPPRVGLLILIRLYKSGDKFGANDTINILEFIAKHTILTTDHDPNLIEEKKDIFSSDIQAFQPHLKQWHAAAFPGTTAWDVFVTSVWSDLDGLDSLTNLITNLRQSSVPMLGVQSETGYENPVTPASPLGQVIRRCYVEFTRLQFGDSQALWKSFAAWRASSWEYFVTLHPGSSQYMEEQRMENNEELNADFAARTHFTQDHSPPAAVDTDLLLTHAIRQLQQLGTRVPDDVKSKLATWVDELAASNAGTQSMHFFMAFFEHSKAGQYTMALESLHRYFDYSLAARSGGAGDNANLRVYYQYALLHLSVLHADFECWEESVDAMNECIATARENQDTACLNFALSWLLYLRHAHPGKGASAFASITGVVGGGEHDEIAFLKTKARESKNWLLLSSTLLEEGRVELFAGGNANRAQEHVLQALYLSVQHDLRTLAPAAQLFYGSCLDRLGQSHLANRQYDLADTIHISHCPISDRVRSNCRAALALAHRGSYDQALAVLDGATSVARGILKSETRVKAFLGLVRLRRSIHRGNHEASTYYLNQLSPLLSSADPEFTHEMHSLQVEHHIARQDYPTAMQRVSALLAGSADSANGTDLAQRLHWLIQKARIFALAGRATKGLSICLRATSTAQRHLLVPVMLEGLSVLGKVLLEVGEFEAARAMYESALPVALEGGEAALVAAMWTAIGESCVGLAGKCLEQKSEDDATSVEIVAEQTRFMRRADECIEQSRMVYQHIEHVEGQMTCLAMKSRINQWTADEVAVKLADEMYDVLAASRRAQEST